MLLLKETCNFRHPARLRHPVLVERDSTMIHSPNCPYTFWFSHPTTKRICSSSNCPPIQLQGAHNILRIVQTFFEVRCEPAIRVVDVAALQRAACAGLRASRMDVIIECIASRMNVTNECVCRPVVWVVDVAALQRAACAGLSHGLCASPGIMRVRVCVCVCVIVNVLEEMGESIVCIFMCASPGIICVYVCDCECVWRDQEVYRERFYGCACVCVCVCMCVFV